VRTRREARSVLTACREAGPRTAALFGLVLFCAAGCRYEIAWPNEPIRTVQDGGLPVERGWQIGRAAAAAPNYIQKLEGGRVVELRFDDNADGQVEEVVDLRGEHRDWPHFLIILDGVPFEVASAMYREGQFRLFAPPSRVVSTFPAMTDVALATMFHAKPCVAMESLYFDRRQNGMSDGNRVYLSGENAPWMSAIDYHAPQDVAVGVYLNPPSVFSRELRDIERLFATSRAAQASAYSVGTAGLGTRGSEPAIRAYLAQIDQVCEKLTYERRGKVRFTITADHGQTLQRCERVSFREALTQAGFSVVKRLRRPQDVVIVEYGLITCALLHTDRPEQVATVLAKHPAVDLAAYHEADAVVVCRGDETARVRKVGDGYLYTMQSGDPLELAGVVEDLRKTGRVSEVGVIDDAAFLAATATHRYPAALHRLWTCFNGLVQQQADVIVSLKPTACHGSKFFHFFVAPVASTHGGLDNRGSVAPLLTNAVSGELPSIVRCEDILGAVGWNPGRRVGRRF